MTDRQIIYRGCIKELSNHSNVNSDSHDQSVVIVVVQFKRRLLCDALDQIINKHFRITS